MSSNINAVNGNNLLLSVKEVNTPQAAIGDVISYTITLTNTTNETITNIRLTDVIDISLQVEENSIGINNVVSVRQSLNSLELPDLEAGAQNEVIFNAQIVRAPSQMDYVLREKAEVFFDYQGTRYRSETSTAITRINIPDPVRSYLLSCLQVSQETAVVGDIVCFKLHLYPNGYFNICGIQLGIMLDNNMEFLPGTLSINGHYIYENIAQVCLPDLIYNDFHHVPYNIAEFKARIISQPLAIRALAVARGNIQYRVGGLSDIFVVNTDEALVEVL